MMMKKKTEHSIQLRLKQIQKSIINSSYFEVILQVIYHQLHNLDGVLVIYFAIKCNRNLSSSKVIPAIQSQTLQHTKDRSYHNKTH